MAEPSTAVIHFYRAAIAHADVWRQRMDTTTNWAVVTNAGVLSFVLGSAETPHFVLLLLLVIDSFFLLMESRRYQIYDIWNARIRLLHQYVFAGALSDEESCSPEEVHENLDALARDLGYTLPRLSLIDALGFRIRRNYFYLFTITVGAWLLKLDLHPQRPATSAEFVARAHVGPIPGWVVFIVLGLVTLASLILAVRAPSDRIINWVEQPAPLHRLLPARWLWRPPTTDEIETHPRRDRDKDRDST